MNITIILIIILTIISLILFTFIWGRETFKPVNGICAFDIDGTSLQGMNNTCYYRNNKYDHTNGGCSAAARRHSDTYAGGGVERHWGSRSDTHPLG